ncbi:MAG: flagellar protein export ATPase FliI [Pseudomonadota bacterium]|nr:flagellar protein export ATPase FliI [Pseudomonadota bacterium]
MDSDARERGRGPPTVLDRLEGVLARGPKLAPRVAVGGVVTEIATSHFRVAGLSRFVRMGEIVRLGTGERAGIGEVVRIDDAAITVKPFDARCNTEIGGRAYRAESLTLWPDENWKGRVVDALGRPLDDAGALPIGERAMALDAEPPPAMRRARVRDPIKTGIRVIDLFTPLCAGQRIGVFAGSGVGKSSLLAMLARAPDFEAVVIALVGERGREVREFLDDTLGDNRDKAVVVVSTGDESPMMRRLAPKTAMSIAEYFRDRGQSVLLIVDSVTRFAHAARDVALAAGEPAVARGYAPSVFSDLPRLLERAGPGPEGAGAITGVFSVLVDGDDHNDPVADNIRGTLDGHIVLDRAIADQGRYPAVNVLGSISRISQPNWTPEQRALVTRLRGLIARFEETRELRLMGGYSAGADPVLDQAVKTVPRIYDAMTQTLNSALCDDPFVELAAALRTPAKAEETANG